METCMSGKGIKLYYYVIFQNSLSQTKVNWGKVPALQFRKPMSWVRSHVISAKCTLLSSYSCLCQK